MLYVMLHFLRYFSILGFGKMNYSKSLGCPCILFPTPFWWPRVVSLHTHANQSFSWMARVPLRCFSSPILCLVDSSHLGFSKFSILCPKHKGLAASVWDSLLCTLDWKFSVGSKLGVTVGLTSFISLLSGITLLHCLSSNVWKPYILAIFLVNWF